MTRLYEAILESEVGDLLTVDTRETDRQLAKIFRCVSIGEWVVHAHWADGNTFSDSDVELALCLLPWSVS